MTLVLDAPTQALVPQLTEILSPEPQDHALESFKINSLEKAQWAAQKIIDAQDRIDFRLAKAKAFKSKIDDWLVSANHADESSVGSLSALLQPFVESELARQRQTRTLKLVEFEASLRRQPERLEIVNADAALKYCEARHPQALIIKKDLSKTELKNLFGQGHLVPGVVLSGGSDRLYIQRR